MEFGPISFFKIIDHGLIVTAAVYQGLFPQLHRGKPRLTAEFNLLAPGRRQALYIPLRVKQSPVFLLNSRSGQVTAAINLNKFKPMAPLLPKLRGDFAEFLKLGLLVRLSILYLSTSVGLRYGFNNT